MASPSQSPIRPVLRLVGFFCGVMAVVVAAQLVLNPPEKRPYVLCWPIYLSAKFMSVTVVKALFPQEHIFALENLMRCERMYNGCTGMAAKIPGFKDSAPFDGQVERLFNREEPTPTAQPQPGVGNK